MANHSATHPAHVQHHFVDSDQQFSSAKLGMWVFLVNELLFFGGLFCAYIIYRAWYPDLFTQSSEFLDKTMGGINTVVLIASSMTVAFAIRMAQINNIKWLRLNLLFTIALAFVFLVIKYFEYEHKLHMGLAPGSLWNPHYGEYPELEHLTHPKANIFFSIYYMLTGVHALHVIIGIGLITWIYIRATKNEFSSEYFTPVEITGLYWHLVDLIWIFLFPLLYLIE